MTSKSGPRSYGEAILQARAIINRGRLADEGEHYPYKREDAERGGVPVAIAAATEAYVNAQQALLEDESEATLDAYRVARDELVAARLDIRGGGRSTTVVTEEG
jgi:ABC-type arginine transport system ATPase subunit